MYVKKNLSQKNEKKNKNKKMEKNDVSLKETVLH